MSAFRVILFSRHALRCSRSLSRHYAGLSAANTRFCRERAQPTQLFVQQQAPARLYSKDNETPWTDVKYDELKALIKSGHVQLVDVREPEEIASTGLLPGAINIPLNRLHIDLKMPEDEFKEKYGVAKPGKDNLLLHCLGGIRSRGALAIAHSLGFEKARHYIGGYAEWVAKQQG
ncbi:thiosulfate:glutathione sulfurtransferase-like isoform X2 [Branchiostoma lanceolatum]|uniref:thiosulfate:glutathione sulfurtransferase-like isoform X2 n=1 Tax=Branchiostoma lanceolatum TaxID=7740 RepID=UPI003456B088